MYLITKMEEALQIQRNSFIQDLKLLKSKHNLFTTRYSSSYNEKKGATLDKKYSKKLNINLGRSYAVWTKYENECLRVAFERGNRDLTSLAKIHNRTPSAIQIRLQRMGHYT